jgi:hypothetical protein
MNKENVFTERKIPIIISIIAIIFGIYLYFYLGIGESATFGVDVPSLYKEMQFKAAYNEKGDLKIFVLANNNLLANLKAKEGNPIPEEDSIVIGNTEAMMMKKEKLFARPGDPINDLFGINTKVEGILIKTGKPIDEFHFISAPEFVKLTGEENRIFILMNPKNEPKLFYSFKPGDKLKLNISLSEGKLDDYRIQEIDGKTFYPLIVGYQEASMMKKENLFKNTGDKIENFFGKNVIIIGIINKSETPIDMMHIIPLTNRNETK